MSKQLVLIAAFLFGAVAVAGCLEPERTSAYQAYGDRGSYTSGFAYNGRGIVPFDGPVYISVNDADNTGSLRAKGKLGPTPFEVTFQQFAPSKPFHDGGIASNLIEHGDSGVGDTSIPRVDLEMAGWGKATIDYGGKPYADPVTGNLTWTAHFMVIRNGVRDNATGAIYANENKTEIYDPEQPRAGVSSPGDYEIHLVLRNGTSGANGSGSTEGRFGSSANAPQPTVMDQETLFNVKQLGSHATVTLKVGDTATRGSNVTFTLRAPSGVVVLEQTLGQATITPGSGETVTVHNLTLQELGDYDMTIRGRLNPGGYYSVAHLIAPPEAIVLNLWWEAIVFGAEAERRADADDLNPSTNGPPSPT